MGFVPFTNVVKLEAVFLWDTQIVENVMHYQVTDGITNQKMIDLAQGWKNQWNTGIKPMQPSTVSLQQIIVTDLSSENAPGYVFTTGLPVSGTQVSPSLPSNCSIAIRWLTGYRGRSYRGRTYHIGLCEADVVDNNVVLATQNGLVNGYTLFRLIENGTVSAALVVASRVHNGVERAIGVATLTTGVQVEPVVDSQRRRLPKRGR